MLVLGEGKRDWGDNKDRIGLSNLRFDFWPLGVLVWAGFLSWAKFDQSYFDQLTPYRCFEKEFKRNPHQHHCQMKNQFTFIANSFCHLKTTSIMALIFFVFCEKSFNRINKNSQKFTTRGRVLLLNVRQTFSLLIKKNVFRFTWWK